MQMDEYREKKKEKRNRQYGQKAVDGTLKKREKEFLEKNGKEKRKQAWELEL